MEDKQSIERRKALPRGVVVRTSGAEQKADHLMALAFTEQERRRRANPRWNSDSRPRPSLPTLAFLTKPEI